MEERSKRIALAAGGGLIILLLVVGLVFFLRSRAQQRDQLADTLQAIDDAQQTCPEGASGTDCRLDAVVDAAGQSGLTAACERLPSTEQDGCITEIAQQGGGPEACADVSDAAARDACYVLAVDARIQTQGVAACDGYPAEEKRAVCRRSFAPRPTLSQCQAENTDPADCADLALQERAVAAKDPSLCLTAENPDSITPCILATGVTDRDGDGLSEVDELTIYETDPLVADTDKDGFSDGSEVQNGYNPNGPGSL